MRIGKEYLSKDGDLVTKPALSQDGKTWSPVLPLVKWVERSSDLPLVKRAVVICCMEESHILSPQQEF